MCILYKKRDDVPAEVTNELTEALIQGTDSILVLGEKFRLHSNIVKAIGISCLGKAMFEAREKKARTLLFNNVITCLQKGLDSYAISKHLCIQQKSLYALAPILAHCNWHDLVEKYKNDTDTTMSQGNEPDEFSFIQVEDDECESDCTEEFTDTFDEASSTSTSNDHHRKPGKYYPVDRCQSRYQSYNKPYQDRRQYSKNDSSEHGFEQSYNQRPYQDRRPYYNNNGREHFSHYNNRHPRVPYNQVKMRYQGMEFYFNCGNQDPQEVVLDLMRKVKAGEL